MVSEATSDHVWNQVIDITRLARYWRRLSLKMTARNNWRTAVLVLPTTGAVVSLLNFLPEWAELAVNGVFAVFACWSVIGRPVEKLAAVREASRKCFDLETEVKKLWRDLGRLDDAQAIARADELDREINRVTTKPAEFGVLGDDDLNEACEAEAHQAIRQEYAA